MENPSEFFLPSDRQVNGSVVVSSLEGTRPLLVELQALVSPFESRDAASYGDRCGFQPRPFCLRCWKDGAVCIFKAKMFVNA